MKIFDADYLNKLTAQSQGNSRWRQHRNIHESYDAPSQRLFNVIEPGSYTRPYRHANKLKDQILIAIPGLMALATFGEQGEVTGGVCFNAGRNGEDFSAGAEVPSGTRHTVIALGSCCFLLKLKTGPFDSNQPKNLAPWAPDENSTQATTYFQLLCSYIDNSESQ
jgi:cupin fold WbuC family metalloprotein